MTLPMSRLACWFRADAGTYQDPARTIPAEFDGAPVGGWADQSGNGFHATQNVAGSRPTLALDRINGLPALRFTSGSAQFLSLGSVLGKPRSWSIFAVMATTSPNIRQSPHGSVAASAQSSTAWGCGVISQINCPAASAAPDFGDGAAGLTLVHTAPLWVANAFNVMGYVHKDNDASILVSKNGVIQSVTALYASARDCVGPASGFSLGREGDYNGLYLSGFIAEFLVYVTDLLPLDRSAVETYLKERWGIL